MSDSKTTETITALRHYAPHWTPAWDAARLLEAKDAEIERLRAEVARLLEALAAPNEVHISNVSGFFMNWETGEWIDDPPGHTTPGSTETT